MIDSTAPMSALMGGPIWQTADPMVARYLVLAIDQFERSHQKDGFDLPPSVRLARSQLDRLRKLGSNDRHGSEAIGSVSMGSAHLGAMLTVEGTADRLGVSKEMVRHWCRHRILLAQKVQGAWTIEPLAVEAMANQRRTPNERIADRVAEV